MSVTSAECTEVEYATERYSESPHPDGTKTDKGDTATRKRRRGLNCAYKWSSIPQAARPRLPPDLFICGKFTARSTTTKCSSAGLLTAPSSFTMQSALPLAKETLLHLRRFVPSPWLCRMPLMPPLDWRQLCSSKCPGSPRRRMLPAKITLHKVYFQRTFLKHFRA
jgi:hypothetical protein